MLLLFSFETSVCLYVLSCLSVCLSDFILPFLCCSWLSLAVQFYRDPELILKSSKIENNNYIPVALTPRQIVFLIIYGMVLVGF